MKVFASISLMLLSYALFWCVPLAFLISAKFASYSNTAVGIITTGFGFGSVINACLNVVWYVTKHPDIKKYTRLICHQRLRRFGISNIFNDQKISVVGRTTELNEKKNTNPKMITNIIV
ncbi:hypothetical protein FO519_010589 [Halicephalobus sp. NKZ332]|nr:hypothetical protein FO519_010589 [Halicephalobus sp. NKZ332]